MSDRDSSTCADYDPEAVMRLARERERIAIEMRRSGMTYEKIGERMGITRERARQIVSKGERLKRQGLVRKPSGLWMHIT